MLHQAAIALTVALSATSAAAATVDRRIVGGENAKEGEFPWVVSLSTSNGICGGALLDSTTVLTAAHCIYMPINIRAGSLKHREGGVESQASVFFTHPAYERNPRDKTKEYYKNDLSILKLATPIEESDKISYVRLPTNGSDPVIGSMSMMAGWGLQTSASSLDAAEDLARVDLPVHDREVCRKIHDRALDRDTVVCAGGKGKTPCSFDSGSPLVDKETRQIIGVTSFVMRDENYRFCDQAPAIFTRVGSFVDWIQGHLGN